MTLQIKYTREATHWGVNGGKVKKSTIARIVKSASNFL